MSFLRRLKNIIRSNLNYSDKSSRIYSYDFDFQSKFDDSINSTQANNFDNNPEKEYYAILELEYGCDFNSIKKAYKKLLKKYHPDLFHNKPEKFDKAQKLTEKINEAYSYFEKKYK